MKVLFVTGLSGKAFGGGRTEEIRLMRGMDAGGCQVALCSDIPGELKSFRHFPLDPTLPQNACRQLAHAVAEFNPDIVHVVGGGIRFLNLCRRQLAEVPWVLTVHNVPPSEHIFRRFYFDARLHYAARKICTLRKCRAWSRFLKSADFRVAFCHSRAVRRDLQNAGCPANKIREIPFGGDLPASAGIGNSAASPFPPDAWPKMMTIAGMAFPKGPLDAVRMAGRLKADFPRLNYLLIGATRDRNYVAYIEREIRTLGLLQNVRLLGAAPDEVKFAALRSADLYVQPSHEEGFCIAYLEAAMLAPRLLGTDTGVISALAEGDPTARVVKPRNLAGLEQAARELLRLQIAPDAVEKRRDALATRYSWDAYVEMHLLSYRAALEKRNPRIDDRMLELSS